MGKPLSSDEIDEAHRLTALWLTPTEVWKTLKAKRAFQIEQIGFESSLVPSLVSSLVPSLVPSLVSSLVPK